jgi:hypothetical protein
MIGSRAAASMSHLSIGFDIGGTTSRAGLVDHRGTLVESVRRPTPQNHDEFVGWIRTMVLAWSSRHHERLHVGLALPGVVDRQFMIRSDLLETPITIKRLCDRFAHGCGAATWEFRFRQPATRLPTCVKGAWSRRCERSGPVTHWRSPIIAHRTSRPSSNCLRHPRQQGSRAGFVTVEGCRLRPGDERTLTAGSWSQRGVASRDMMSSRRRRSYALFLT